METGVMLLELLCFMLFTNVAYSDEVCGEEPQVLNVTSKVQVLTSPGWTEHYYPANLFCVYNFNVPDGKYVLVIFTDFQLEGDMTCQNDFVELTLNGKGARSMRYCGEELPTPIFMYSKYIPQMLFRTNNNTSNRGFRLEYKLVDSENFCAKDELKCGNMKCVKNFSKCNGKDECGDGTDEENCHVHNDKKPVCGKPKVSPKGETKGLGIFGGTTAVPGSAPWQVSLQNRDIHPSGHSCGGALIDKEWVLTAGHCISRMFNLRIKIGNYDQMKDNEEEEVRYAAYHIVHPEFNPFQLENDLALIKLNAPVIVTDDVMPICLPKINSVPKDGTMCYATGWGRNSTTDTSGLEDLNQVEVPIFNLDKCKKIHKTVRNTVTDTNVCTGFADGRHNPCYGDSGGPLVTDKNGLWDLVGIVSFGAKVCGDSQPTVYTLVSKYITWINATIHSSG